MRCTKLELGAVYTEEEIRRMGFRRQGEFDRIVDYVQGHERYSLVRQPDGKLKVAMSLNYSYAPRRIR